MYSQMLSLSLVVVVFFFNASAATEIYTLSLHDALPISWFVTSVIGLIAYFGATVVIRSQVVSYLTMAFIISLRDRKSTRLNSSHMSISYAVFCLKKKKQRRRLESWPRLPDVRQSLAHSL